MPSTAKASDFLRSERDALAEALTAAGPDAPTLCSGWQTRDLAAHMVIREDRPDAAIGMVLSPLAGWSRRVQSQTAAKPYGDLVERIRRGPGLLGLFAIPGVDSTNNVLEYFVHHEDIRRARADWQPRELPTDVRELLWRRMGRMTRYMLRGVTVGVQMRATDVADGNLRARSGEPTVTVQGSVSELIMLLFGRRESADVRLSGSPEAIAAFQAANLNS
ncbi:MAG: TIGR03085 family metal-binding protein [Candidatus Nanopelagicales bacterium]